MKPMNTNNAIPAIDPTTATPEAMRAWIPATSRALAIHLHGSPTPAALRAVLISVGYPDLRSALENDRECVAKLCEVATFHGLMPATILAKDLPKDPIIGAYVKGIPHRKAFLVKSEDSYMMMHADGAHVGDHFLRSKGSFHAALSHPHLVYILFDDTASLFAWLAAKEAPWSPESTAFFDDGDEP